MAVLVPRKTPLAFTSITRSQSAAVVFSTKPAAPMPALLTKMSSLPKRATVVLMASAHESSFVTSKWRYRASPPRSLISASTWRPSASRTSPMTTLAPSWEKRRASSAPMPLAPPLMNATFPSSLMLHLRCLDGGPSVA